jgi:isoquinoline 1-oxidoreductase beta subunit
VAAALGPERQADGEMTLRMTSQSVTGRVFGLPGDVPDQLMTEAALAPYEIPAIQHDSGLRVGYWRSVSHCSTPSPTRVSLTSWPIKAA